MLWSSDGGSCDDDDDDDAVDLYLFRNLNLECLVRDNLNNLMVCIVDFLIEL